MILHGRINSVTTQWRSLTLIIIILQLLFLDKITILNYAASPSLPCPTHLNQPWPPHGGHTMTVMHIIIGGGPPSPLGVPRDKGWKCSVWGKGLAGPRLGWRALRPPPGRDKTQQGFLHANRHDPWTPHKEHHFRSHGHSVWESKEEPIEPGWGLWVLLRESDHWLDRGKKQEQEREIKDQEREKGDKGKILCFCLGESACCKSSKGFPFSASVPFSYFSPPILSVC